MLITREVLLQKDKLKIEKVQLNKTDFVFVKEMTGREKNNFEQSIVKIVRKGKETTSEMAFDDYKAKLAVNTVCDAKGDLLLKPKDYETLSMNIGAAKLEKIVNAAQELNKISEEDKEDMVKN